MIFLDSVTLSFSAPAEKVLDSVSPIRYTLYRAYWMCKKNMNSELEWESLLLAQYSNYAILIISLFLENVNNLWQVIKHNAYFSSAESLLLVIIPQGHL